MNTTHTQEESRSTKGVISAVLFLSTASVAQTERDVSGEPIRIKNQREAAYRKATELGAGAVKIFVEIGSAWNQNKRPALQDMLDYLREHPNVTYAIFPSPHRFSRSMRDSVALLQRFKELDVTVAFSHGSPSRLYTIHDDFMMGLAQEMAELDAQERSKRAGARRATATAQH